MYFVIVALIITNHYSYDVHGLTCNEIMDRPNDERINFLDLQTMKMDDIIQCVLQLGRNKLDMNEAEYIWRAIVESHDGISNIPEEILANLNWITIAITPEQYSNITLSDIDVITNFGRDYNLNTDQLGAIADRVREDFGGKEPNDYTQFDLIALRQILCAFNRSEIEGIHPSAYKEAASIIGKINHCSSEVMQGFATLATKKDGFGSTSSWTNYTIEILGHVSEHFPKDLITKIRNRKEI